MGYDPMQSDKSMEATQPDARASSLLLSFTPYRARSQTWSRFSGWIICWTY
jgi:hypothetical protein